MSKYGFSAESVIVLYREELISAKTALRELHFAELDSSFLEDLMNRPVIQAIEVTGNPEHDHLVMLVNSQILSRRTAMQNLGIEDPDREFRNILLEKMTKRPEVQAFIREAAQRVASTRRARHFWRYPLAASCDHESADPTGGKATHGCRALA